MNNAGLFRKEVTENRTPNLHGDVWMVAPTELRVMLWIILAISVFFLTVGLLANHTAKLTVPGKVLPEKGIVRVPAPRPGLVASVYVTSGQIVRKGEPLFTLTSPAQLHDGAGHRKEQLRLVDEELEQVASIEATLLSQIAIRKKELERRIELANDELNSKKEELSAQKDLLRNEEHKLAAYQRLLTNGTISMSDVLSQEGSALAAKRLLLSLSAEVSSIQDRLVTLRTSYESIPFEVENTNAEFAARRVQLQQDRTEIEASYEVTLVAPSDGKIVDLRLRQGQFAETSETLLVITPADSELYAELYAPSKSVGAIKIGQSVLMKFEAYPADRFGSFTGKVRSVSEVVMSEADISRGQDLTAPAFVVYVELDKQSFSRRGEPIPLQAGLDVQSDIVVARQSMLSWIIGKLLNLDST